MPQVNLAEYTARIAEQIETGNVEEAIAHCRHILAHYPRYLPAYKLLAHACLEKGDFAHANHFFQCVLSADPEDADAWMNLALLSDDLGELEQATWLMERAFEVEPGNAEIRELLRQLYSRRDGLERTRIKLTRGALARLYAKGGFYKRAVQELEEMLQASPTLPRSQIAHIEVALSKALWSTEDMAPMADRVCQSLLQKLPNCLQANLIMGQLRWSASARQEAEPYLRIARRLDPEGRFADEMFGDRSPLPLTEVQIPYLEYQVAQVEQVEAAAPEVEDTSWLDRIGESVEALTLEEETEAPDWLKSWTQEEMLMPTSIAEEPGEEGAIETREETTLPPKITEPTEEGEPEVPDWLLEIQRETLAEPTTEEEVPDWLRELSQEGAREAPPEAVLEPSPEEELPDWLQELAPPGEAEAQVEAAAEAVVEPTPEEGLPDWLLELSREGEPEEEEAPPTAAPEPELTSLLEEAPTQPELEEELPDWLRELSEEGEAATPTMAAIEPTPEGELPDWLQKLRPEAETEAPAVPVAKEVELEAPTEAAIEPMLEEELPDWLRELEAEVTAEQPLAVISEEGEPIALAEETPVELAPEEEAPEWLRELSETAPEAAVEAVLEPTSEEEISDWLRELGPAGEIEPEAAPEVTLEPTPEGELPDWLRELRAQAEIEEPVSPIAEEGEIPPLAEVALEATLEEELPDWLEQLRPTSETPIAEALRATEEGELPTAIVEELPPPVEGMPDWLVALEGELGGRVTAPEAEEELPPAVEAAIELQAAEIAPPEEEVPARLAELEVEAAPEWLPEPEWETTEAALEEAPSPTAELEETPEWFVELEEEPVSTVTVEEMPDWLDRLRTAEAEEAIETEPAPEIAEPPPSVEELEWLQELEQISVPEPIEIEEEPITPAWSGVEGPVPTKAPTAEGQPPEMVMPSAEEQPPEPAVVEAAAPLEEASVIQGYRTQLASSPEDAETRLALARAYLRERALDDSAREYEQLVRVPDLTETLTKELEEIVQIHPDHHALHRVLGDAYMRAGQLQKALNAYREALNKI